MSTPRTGRALVVHESLFGNTARLAEAVADGLRGHGFEVEVTPVAQAPVLADLEELDLLVVGAPTHAFSLSRPATRSDAVRQGAEGVATTGLREWLASGPASGPVPTVCFDTRADKVRHLPGSAARKATRLAKEAGLSVSTPAESFYVQDVSGPLLPGELARAATWGHDLTIQPVGRG